MSRNPIVLVAIILMAAASIIIVQPSAAQTVVLSASEFTATSDGATLTVSVKNPQFTPFEENGSRISLYYDVRSLGVGDNTWREMHLPGQPSPATLDQSYTVLQFMGLHYPAGSKVDVQVRTAVGSMYLVNGRLIGGYDFYVFNGERGDWSASQTITVSGTNNPTSYSPSQNPTATANISSTPTSKTPNLLSNFDWQTIVLFIMAAMIAGLTLVVTLLWRKVARQHSSQ